MPHFTSIIEKHNLVAFSFPRTAWEAKTGLCYLRFRIFRLCCLTDCGQGWIPLADALDRSVCRASAAVSWCYYNTLNLLLSKCNLAGIPDVLRSLRSRGSVLPPPEGRRNHYFFRRWSVRWLTKTALVRAHSTNMIGIFLYLLSQRFITARSVRHHDTLRIHNRETQPCGNP